MRRTNSGIWGRMERAERVVDRSFRQLGHSDPSPSHSGIMLSPEELEELGRVTDIRNANKWAKANAPRRR